MKGKSRHQCRASEATLLEPRREKSTLDERKVSAVIVLLPLSDDQFLICQIANDRLNRPTKRAKRGHAAVTISGLVAPVLIRPRPNQDWDLLSIISKTVFERFKVLSAGLLQPISNERWIY